MAADGPASDRRRPHCKPTSLPSPRSGGSRPGCACGTLNLERLPTAYTNKWVIFREGGGVSTWEISVALGKDRLKGQAAGHGSVTETITLRGNG